MFPDKKFKLTVALVTLVLFGTLLAACSELSSVNLAAAASASRPVSDDPATLTPAGLPVITPLATVEQEQEIELKGIIQKMAGNSITVNGQAFTLAPDMLAQRGNQLKVGSIVELKARLISGVLTVVRLQVEDLTEVETSRSTPTTAATAMPDTTATSAADDDQRDDHGRDEQGQGQGTGKIDDTQPDDHSKDEITRTPTLAPAKTPRPAKTVAPTAKAPGSNSNKGSNSPKGDDSKTSTAPASPTQPARQLSATATPRTTEAGDDKGQDNNVIKVEDKTRSASTATPRPSEAGDDRGGKGKTDDTVRPPTAKPDEKAGSSTPKPVQTTDDRGGKGKGESGDDNKGQGGK